MSVAQGGERAKGPMSCGAIAGTHRASVIAVVRSRFQGGLLADECCHSAPSPGGDPDRTSHARDVALGHVLESASCAIGTAYSVGFSASRSSEASWWEEDRSSRTNTGMVEYHAFSGQC